MSSAKVFRHAHALNCYELHFITNGRGELETYDRVYHLKRGDFHYRSNYCHAQSACVDDPVEDVFFLVQARDTNGQTPFPPFLKIHFRSIAVLTVLCKCIA
ncbi:MAG: hypothetical protein ACLR6O_00790 [Eubacterium sp.]